jgi:CCR4-NOT transcription complex subunit 1
MNWLEVMKQLDNPRFKLFDQRGLNLLVNIYKLATGQVFPVQILFDSWANVPSQLYFVRTALSAPAEVFNFSSAGKLLPAMEGLHLSNNSATVAHNWHSLSLVEALLELSADDEYYLVVRSLFDYPIKHCPELLLLVIMHISPSHTTLKDELISILMPLFLVSSHPHFTAVLSQLWTLDKTVVIKAMVDLYNLDASHLSRVLDIAQELKELKSVLESSNFLFALDLASLASRREYLNLEKWIQEMVQLHQEPFVRSCLEFITVSRELRVQRIVTDFSQRSQATQQGKANLTPELANVFLHTLQTIVP